MALDDNSNDFLKHAIKRAIVSDLINERIEAYKTELESLQKAEHGSGCPFSINSEEVESCTCLAKAQGATKPSTSLGDKFGNYKQKWKATDRKYSGSGGRPIMQGLPAISRKLDAKLPPDAMKAEPPTKKEEANPPDNSAGTNMFMAEGDDEVARTVADIKRTHASMNRVRSSIDRADSEHGAAWSPKAKKIHETKMKPLNAQLDAHHEKLKELGHTYDHLSGKVTPINKGEDYDDNNGRTVMSKVTKGAKVPASVAGKKKVNPPPPPNGLVPSQKIPDNNDAEVKTPGNKLPIKKADPMFLKEGKKAAVKKAQGGVAPPKAMKPVMPAKPQVGPMGATGGGGMGKTEGLDKAVLPQHKEAIRRDALQGAFQSAKQSGAAPAKATPAPKMPSPEEHAQRNSGIQDFMPKGKWDKSELGKCAYGCGKSEHLEKCGMV